MEYMNVYRFMFVGVEVKNKTEIFKYLWHSLSIIYVAKIVFSFLIAK